MLCLYISEPEHFQWNEVQLLSIISLSFVFLHSSFPFWGALQ